MSHFLHFSSKTLLVSVQPCLPGHPSSPESSPGFYPSKGHPSLGQRWPHIGHLIRNPISPISHSVSGASLTFTAKIPGKTHPVLPKSSFPAGTSCSFLLAGPESQTPRPAAEPEANPTLPQQEILDFLPFQSFWPSLCENPLMLIQAERKTGECTVWDGERRPLPFPLIL